MEAFAYSALTFVLCAACIFAFARFFGLVGLVSYSLMAVIASNIQVLKAVRYFDFETCVPLGTVVFATTFAVDNIINEHYGHKVAKKSVYLSFAGYLSFSIIMLLADWHPNVLHTNCINMWQEIHNLFSPSLAIFSASVIAYLVGQLCDVYIFSFLKKNMTENSLSIRSCISMGLSTIIDNCVFSILAWKVFYSVNIPWSELFATYIISTSIFRFFISIFCIPLVRLSYYFIKKDAII